MYIKLFKVEKCSSFTIQGGNTTFLATDGHNQDVGVVPRSVCIDIPIYISISNKK